MGGDDPVVVAWIEDVDLSGFDDKQIDVGLARAKDAYVAAQFQEAARRLQQTLIELEDITDVESRVTYLAEARCYLAFTYFATQEREHVQVELRRLAAFDPAFAVCGQDAPPGVRALIAELRRQTNP